MKFVRRYTYAVASLQQACTPRPDDIYYYSYNQSLEPKIKGNQMTEYSNRPRDVLSGGSIKNGRSNERP